MQLLYISIIIKLFYFILLVTWEDIVYSFEQEVNQSIH